MIFNITEAIAEAAEFIYATLDHAADCEIENTGDFNKHCEIESYYVPHLKEIADVLRQAAPTSRHQPGCDLSGSHRRGCTFGFNGPHDPIKWCADNCPRCEDMWTSKMERAANIQ